MGAVLDSRGVVVDSGAEGVDSGAEGVDSLELRYLVTQSHGVLNLGA